MATLKSLSLPVLSALLITGALALISPTGLVAVLIVAVLVFGAVQMMRYAPNAFMALMLWLSVS